MTSRCAASRSPCSRVALGEHVFLLRLQHREPPDFLEIAGQAAVAGLKTGSVRAIERVPSLSSRPRLRQAHAAPQRSRRRCTSRTIRAYNHVVFATAIKDRTSAAQRVAVVAVASDSSQSRDQRRHIGGRVGASKRSASPVAGCSNAEQSRVQRLPAESRGERSAPARAALGLGAEAGAVDGVADQRMADMRPCARGSGGCGRSPAGRRRSAATGLSPRRRLASTRVVGDACAAAGARPRPASGGCAVSGRGGHRSCRCGGSARPRQGRRIRGRAGPRGRGRRTARRGRGGRASFLATTSRPDVSLSSRCTMPGRFTPPMPERLVAAMGDERVDQRAASRLPARGMHDQPGRLVDDDQVVVLVDDGERDVPRPAGSAGSPAAARVIPHGFARVSPAGAPRLSGVPSTATWPPRISAFARVRAAHGGASAMKASRRAPADAAGTVRRWRSSIRTSAASLQSAANRKPNCSVVRAPNSGPAKQ